MKTKTMQKWLLLEQTGELSPRRKQRLNACPEAQALREELRSLYASIPESSIQPSPWSVAKIDARLREERRSTTVFSKHWKTALALAACLTATVGILNFHGGQVSSSPAVAVATVAGVDVWSVPIEEDLSKLESLIVAISGDPLDIMEM